jgi:hypothetical protein
MPPSKFQVFVLSPTDNSESFFGLASAFPVPKANTIVKLSFLDNTIEVPAFVVKVWGSVLFVRDHRDIPPSPDKLAEESKTNG